MDGTELGGLVAVESVVVADERLVVVFGTEYVVELALADTLPEAE